uniref:Cytidyltransferase-like domain-containing protein n=1 Tax=Tetradesmus obliquus TaxID=3088 RepID=A0A383VA40_TETOB|eukprot:jgi/Sobl393_1/9671/SZX62445.1
MKSCLALVPADSSAAELEPVLAQAKSCNCDRIYITTTDGADLKITQQLLDWLCELYSAVAAVDPRQDAVPCLAAAGWTADQLAALPDVQLLLAPEALHEQAAQLQQQLNTGKAPETQLQLQLQLVPVITMTAPEEPSSQHNEQQQSQEQQQQEKQQQEQLLFDHVAVGGTFDRLHAGHRLLLAATALVCSKQVYAGITADNLLAKKSHKQLLHDYEERRAAAVDFMVLVRPGLTVTAGALSDPQEPTQAELDPTMRALVVSQETLPGGQAINNGRASRGFEQLQLVVVGLVGGGSDSKLSSTALREADAAAAGPDS